MVIPSVIVRHVAIAVLTFLMGAWTALHYDRIKYKAKEAERLEAAQKTNEMLRQSLAEAEKARYEELEQARQRVSDLERDVLSGKRRLRQQASCSQAVSRVAADVDDAAGAKPARGRHSLESDILRLGNICTTAIHQRNALQEWIRVNQTGKESLPQGQSRKTQLRSKPKIKYPYRPLN